SDTHYCLETRIEDLLLTIFYCPTNAYYNVANYIKDTDILSSLHYLLTFNKMQEVVKSLYFYEIYINHNSLVHLPYPQNLLQIKAHHPILKTKIDSNKPIFEVSPL